ncbi:MAG: alpha/beta hydrolase [Holophaga sp.]|nr:alpha/beta hydrolase [Holophaga sp.]
MPNAPSLHIEDIMLTVGNHQLGARWIRHHAHRKLEPTLVFLHEGLGSIAQWRDFPETLARQTGLPALVYDRLGHGTSPALSEPRTMHYLEEEALVVLPRMLACCGIENPILVGHSDGGSIALLFASKFPEVPRAVISEAAHVFLEPITRTGLQAAKEAFDHGLLRGKLARFHGEKIDALFQTWCGTWLDPASHDWDITSPMSNIQAPLLMVQGENDDYGSPAQILAVTRRVQGPTETLMIPHCGHIPHFQANQIVLSRIRAFLQKFVAPFEN